jgi:hypothetical protein
MDTKNIHPNIVVIVDRGTLVGSLGDLYAAVTGMPPIDSAGGDDALVDVLSALFVDLHETYGHLAYEARELSDVRLAASHESGVPVPKGQPVNR